MAPLSDVASFPILSEKEIVADLCDLGIRKEEATIAVTKASPDSVRRIFEIFLDKVYNQGRNNLAPDFRCMGQLRHPEIHDDGICDLELLRALRHWLNVCGVSDVSLKDINDPQPKRVRRQLSALLNMTKFCEWKGALEEELEDEIEAGFERQSQLQASLAAQAEECEALAAEDARRRQAAAELREQRAEAKAALRDGSAGFEASSERLDAVTGELTAVEQRIKAVRFMHQADRENSIRQLTSRIVKSPEKLPHEISELKAALERVNADDSGVEQLALQFQHWSHCAAKVHKEASEVFSYLSNKVEPTMREAKAVSAECKALKDELEHAQLEHEALVAQSNQLQQTLQAANEALARDLKQNVVRKDAAFSKLEMARRELEKNEARVEMVNASIDENLTRVKKQRDKREEYEEMVCQKTKQLLAQYGAAVRALARYHAKFAELGISDGLHPGQRTPAGKPRAPLAELEATPGTGVTLGSAMASARLASRLQGIVL